MQYAHSHSHGQPMFEAAPLFEANEEQKVDYHQFRRNFATFTGGLLTGAVLAVAGVMAMNAYEQAMQPVAIAPEVEQTQVVDSGSFPVGAQVVQTSKN